MEIPTGFCPVARNSQMKSQGCCGCSDFPTGKFSNKQSFPIPTQNSEWDKGYRTQTIGSSQFPISNLQSVVRLNAAWYISNEVYVDCNEVNEEFLETKLVDIINCMTFCLLG